MKQIKFGYTNDSDCLKVAQGIFEASTKLGIKNTTLHNIFSKNYNITDFMSQLAKIIHNPNGTMNVNLCLDSSPYSELTPEKKLLIPKEGKDSGNFINRFPPVDYNDYSRIVNELINHITNSLLLPYVSFESGQESNAKKYYWGTFEEWKIWTQAKYNLVSRTNRPFYIGNFTTSLIQDSSFHSCEQWMDYINNDPIFNLPNVKFSHSFYWKNQGGFYSFNNNNYPTRFTSGTAVTEFNYWAGTGAVVDQALNSPLWMIWIVKFLQEIVNHNYPIDIIYLYSLLDCNNIDSKGTHAAWTKIIGTGYTAKPMWYMQMDLINVLKQLDGTFGYTVTPDGIAGSTKKIVINETTSTYTIVNK